MKEFKGPDSVTITLMTNTGKVYTFQDIVAVSIISPDGVQTIVRPDRQSEFSEKSNIDLGEKDEA